MDDPDAIEEAAWRMPFDPLGLDQDALGWLEAHASRSSPPPRPSARERVAANIRRLRKANGLSQEQLAEAAAFHRTYVSQLERGVTNISISGLERLAQALGVDVAALLQPPT